MSKTVISETLSLTSRKDEVIKACEEAIMRGLAHIGEAAEGYAKDDCPVDTGRLKASISNKAVDDEMAVYIGTNVEYAPYVEYRDIDHKSGKAHFLRDAAAEHSKEYKDIMKGSLEAGAPE